MLELQPPSPAADAAERIQLPPMLAEALPAACLATLAAVLASMDGRHLDVERLAGRLGLDRNAALAALDDAEGPFHEVFGMHVLPPHRAWSAGDDPAADAAADGADAPSRVRLSTRFLDLLDPRREPLRTEAPAPVPDGGTATWIAAIAAAAADGGRLHLALRCRGDGGRDARDLSILLARAGIGAIRLKAVDRALAAGLLGAELCAHAPPAVVVIGKGALVEDRVGAPEDEWGSAGVEEGSATAFALRAATWLKLARRVCVWCVAEDAVLPAALDGLVAGCVGPIQPDASWSRGIVEAAVGSGVGPAGVAAIASSLEDPRDAPARGRAARMLARSGLAIDDACAFVARSFAPPEPPMPEPDFDFGLVDDEEVHLLRDRAREVASAGGRLLFHGPPGGGKSALVRALAHEMVGGGACGPAIVVTATSVLVKAFGGTERLMERLWRRAEVTRSLLIVDELDAMCGVRDAGGSSSGNAYLVRGLTDEWIRRFDAHPGVAVLATCNDPAAIDPAILRRFHGRHLVGDELPPGLERRAWATILGMEPPPRWTPCGAAPSDFAGAKARCRMLGLGDAASLAAAVAKARDARRGPRAPARKPAGPAH